MRCLAFVCLLWASSVAAATPPIVIEAQYPGASAEVIADVVVAPLEQQLNGAEGVRRIRSLALEGRCFVRLDLAPNAAILKARQAAVERLALAQGALPALVGVKLLPSADDAVLLIALRPSGKADLSAVSKLARETIQPALLRIPRVADVDILGDEVETLRVVVDSLKMQAHNLSTLDIVKALERANAQVAAGQIGQPPLPLDSKALVLEVRKALDIDAIALADRGGAKVFLRDVAKVVREAVRQGEAGVAVREDSKIVASSAVLLVVQMSPKGLATVPKALDKALTDLTAKIPAGVRIEKHLLIPDDTAVVLRLPASTSLERRAQNARAAAAAALRQANVHAGFWLVKNPDDHGLLLLATDSAKKTQIRADLREHLPKVEGVARIGGLVSPLLAWPGDGMQIVLRVTGEDHDELRKTAEQLRSRLAKVTGVVDLDSASRTRIFQVVQIDREKCATLGVTVVDVANALTLAHGGADFNRFGRSLTVTLTQPDATTPAHNFRTLTVRSRAGKVIPLTEVATLREMSAPASIQRENGRPCLIVSCNVHGRDAVETRKEVVGIAKDVARKGVRIAMDDD